MKTKLSYGYPLPSPESATLTDYVFTIGTIPVLGDNFQDQPWDYESPVSCTFTIDADLARILRESSLVREGMESVDAEPRLGIALTWFSTKTKLRGRSPLKRLKNGVNELSLEIEGSLLGGSLVITTVIALLDDVVITPPRLAPKAQGTILWTSDDIFLPLEGSGSRLAMAPVNFTKSGIKPRDALWLVQLSESLEVPVSSGVRVLVNIANPITKKMLDNPSTPEADVWQKEMETELITLMINHGIRNFDSDSDAAEDGFDEGSLGQTISALMNSLFPKESLEDLADDPERVSATIRASVFNRKDS